MKKSRRAFLSDLGKLSSVLVFSGELLDALPAIAGQEQEIIPTFRKKNPREPLDFRYAPSRWQTTYSLPEDSASSIIDKNGMLLLGQPATKNDYSSFPVRISFGITGQSTFEYIEQKLDSPEIPVITTRVKYGATEVRITSFATKEPGEGRVDNHIFEILSPSAELKPGIMIESATGVSLRPVVDPDLSRKGASAVSNGDDASSILFVVDAPANLEKNDKAQIIVLPQTQGEPVVKYFVRFPREKQLYDALKAGLKKPEDLLTTVIKFWQALAPVNNKVKFAVHPEYQPFVAASVRNIMQATEAAPKKRIFHPGAPQFKEMFITDAVMVIEALRLLGYDKEAQEGLETIWDMQDEKGYLAGSAGTHSFKDTAAAVYALGRQAALSQNYDYFKELYPDAYNALIYLSDQCTIEHDKGKTLNGKYGFVPRGTIDTGVDGVRADATNSLWTIMALRQALEVADRFYMVKRTDFRDFERLQLLAFQAYLTDGAKIHPNGFKYIPMILGDDPLMKQKDKTKRPLPQYGTMSLTQALFPGLIFPSDHLIVQGHLQLMNSIMEEELPSGTGQLGKSGVEMTHGAALAQFYAWISEPQLASATFRGFLNHASPLLGWRKEQSVHSVQPEEFFGSMPDSLAAAECILYLRNALILEDLDSLRLLCGIAEHDFAAGQPIVLLKSPTKWGRVSLSIEPVNAKNWTMTFKREEFNSVSNPVLKKIEFPRRLTPKLQLDKVSGAKVNINGEKATLEPTATDWVASYKIFT